MSEGIHFLMDADTGYVIVINVYGFSLVYGFLGHTCTTTATNVM